MPKKPTPPPDSCRMFTVRLELDTIQRLTRQAGAMQLESGRNVTVSDLVRRALADYLRKVEK